MKWSLRYWKHSYRHIGVRLTYMNDDIPSVMLFVDVWSVGWSLFVGREAGIE